MRLKPSLVKRFLWMSAGPLSVAAVLVAGSPSMAAETAKRPAKKAATPVAAPAPRAEVRVVSDPAPGMSRGRQRGDERREGASSTRPRASCARPPRKRPRRWPGAIAPRAARRAEAQREFTVHENGIVSYELGEEGMVDESWCVRSRRKSGSPLRAPLRDAEGSHAPAASEQERSRERGEVDHEEQEDWSLPRLSRAGVPRSRSRRHRLRRRDDHDRQRQRARRGVQRSDASGSRRRQSRHDPRPAAPQRIHRGGRHLGRDARQHRGDLHPGELRPAGALHPDLRRARLGGSDPGRFGQRRRRNPAVPWPRAIHPVWNRPGQQAPRLRRHSGPQRHERRRHPGPV